MTKTAKIVLPIVTLFVVSTGATACGNADDPSRYTTPEACQNAGYEWEADNECDYRDSKKKKSKKSKTTKNKSSNSKKSSTSRKK